MKALSLLFALTLTLALAGGALAAAASPPACAAPEFRQLDFWVGEWDLTWQGGKGTNVITRELDDCVIHEHFTGDASVDGMRGESVSTYQPGPKLWRQTWVDNQSGYIPLTGGPRSDGTFLLETTRLNPQAARSRMIFENIKADSFTWRWQKSTDDGKTWSDNWVITYKRKT